MDLLYTLGITAVTLGIVVAVHEYGHFQVARWCGVKVLRFSIGFGPALWRRQGRQGTEFVIAAIPLGGYVKMQESRSLAWESLGPAAEAPPASASPEQDTGDMDGAFDRKPLAQRTAVVLAGPLANLLLAVLAYWIIGIVGEVGIAPVVDGVRPGSPAERAGVQAGQEIVAVDGRATFTQQAVAIGLLERMGDSGRIRLDLRYPDSDVVQRAEAPVENWLAEAADINMNPLQALGLEMYRRPIPPLLGEVAPDYPAVAAGLAPGDLILAVDGVPTPQWEDLTNYVRVRPGEPIDLDFEREGVRHSTRLTLARYVIEEGDEAGTAIGLLGVSVQVPPYPESMRRTTRYGPLEAVHRTGAAAAFILKSIGKMLAGLISPKNLNGPITIAKVASDTAQMGLMVYISFIALLSVSLGVLNLLPIPMLDGGHLLYYAIELAAGRPLPEKVQIIGFQLGLAVILGVMGLAVFNDLAGL